ncbi:hypothetical protein KIH27_03355 [Mycobacterium sp. M1]|uniref:Uncharacterized protein n=1 Tax=Mycolicibacter acidiphilus TaxID=2835306 RepID=A0ABS5REB3_9MYCO|nr:hypothetical protein [Mycolicibacter acidiphilus]MBS9532620.1 hypothetical protein [Mycolicibacter acidiphilus]
MRNHRPRHHPHHGLLYGIERDIAHAREALAATKWGYDHLPPDAACQMHPHLTDLSTAILSITEDMCVVHAEISTTKRPRPAALTQAQELRSELADRLFDLETTISTAGKVSR